MTTSNGADSAPKRQAGYRDLLLALVSYPDRAPETGLRNAAKLAARLGGEVTALALIVRVVAPRSRLADLLIDLDELVRTEEGRSTAHARALLSEFEALAREAGTSVVSHTEAVDLYSSAERFAHRARTHDLAIVPFGSATANDRSVAEALLFQSGRPVLLVPDATPIANEGRLNTVAVAWDGERPAARALADAMPLLESVGRARVLVITGEKASVAPGAAADVVRHLAQHGVTAEVDEVDAAGAPIGEVMAAYVARQGIELMVMGAFGRSRARELILGGATRSILQAATIPVLMSH